MHIAEAEGVAKQDLVFLLLLRVSQSANALIIAIYSYFRGGDLKDFATVHLLFTLCLMLIILVLRKTNPLSVRYKTIEEIKALFKLIKYTLATLATTNILKSADTFLISSFMGPAAVAKYAIPLKLTEFFEIPLRSLSTTAFPQLAAKNNEGDLLGFKNTFVQYISWAYMLYIPGLILTLFVAPYLVLIIGGKQYADTTPIFMVFILYGLLLPSDRMTGISLDALQKPALNFRKVFIMAIVNILADLAAIYFTHRLEWVAFASVLNVLTGAILGFTMLERTNCLPRFSVWKEVSEYSFSFARKVIAQKNK
ncbi:lipopolysaccharide biosynthesis protein [Pseudarcicella hirudinis]|uniref:lipopolysaccharide biosynthesis protein n=1 Tax=Pseudarcicella hirudinis TaxID=1079859 RepID=UPI0035E6B676